MLQTSQDGWTCGTPLVALTDARDAMLAVAMNGEPLPLEHGFPVRTIVPGLYGYVSACKWVVDLEVTRFDGHRGLLDGQGLGRAGAGQDRLADRRPALRRRRRRRRAPRRWRGLGAAHRHRGGRGLRSTAAPGSRAEVAPRARPTTPGCSGWPPSTSTPGDHQVQVRAIDKHGTVQTGVERDVLPDGATGWHTVDFTAEDA